MARVSELLNRKQAQERARQESLQPVGHESSDQQYEDAGARQHKEDVQRRGKPLKQRLEQSPIPELLNQVSGAWWDGNVPEKGSRYTGVGEDERGVYASQEVYYGYGGSEYKGDEVEVKLYEDGEVAVIGKRTHRLRGWKSQDPDTLDRVIGRAAKRPRERRLESPHEAIYGTD